MTGVGGSRQRVLLVPVLVVTVAVTLLAGFHTVTVRQVCALFALAVCATLLLSYETSLG
jgi:hypothetical protein